MDDKWTKIMKNTEKNQQDNNNMKACKIIQ